MHFTDVRIDLFGSLTNTTVDNLSRKLTVLYGPNGSGKTTCVRFLRGLLFGFRRASSESFSFQGSESGFARIQSDQGSRKLQRSWSSSGVEQFTVSDDVDRLSVTQQDNYLPTWVSEDVFREVFSVGYLEADRFDLLSRLCIESGVGVSSRDASLVQAESGLLQTVRDRDGNGIQGGVVHRISELRRRQGELQGEISLLRKPAGDLPLKIDQLICEIDASTSAIDRIDAKLTETDAQIARLEQRLIEFRRRNSLPLDRHKVEEEIRVVSDRLDRWKEIRALINRQTEPDRVTQVPNLRANDSVRSIRAIVSRLEERVLVLTDRQRSIGVSDTELSQDADAIRQLRFEIAALCQYFGHHERTLAKQAESAQALFANRCLSDSAEIEKLLEEQLVTLRADLARSENILAENAVPAPADGCRFVGHRESLTAGSPGTSEFRTLADVEDQIQRLRVERGRLAAERVLIDEASNTKRILLERLRQELVGAVTLEQLDALRAQIAAIDTEIALLEDQRRQLDRTEASLREVIERLKTRGYSRVLELASAYVRRLTEGECQQISATRPDRLHIHTMHHSDPLSLAQLSRGTRDQLALALRLALIQVRSETHGHVPLILDDVFITSDDARAAATVQLLTEIAQQGQQIIFFTCQRDVRDLFARFGADIRPFGARTEIPTLPVQAPASVVLHAYVEPAIESPPVVANPVVIERPSLTLPETIEPVQLKAATNWLFYLEVDHGVEELAGITLGELEALRTSGILNIDDLLNRTVPQLEEMTRQKGFVLSVERLHALRGQAELTTRVPMLRRSDAALLFASGIRTVEELSRLRPETVYNRVTEFQRSEAGSRFRRGGRLIDRQQAINWARFGQCTRSLDDARHSRSRLTPRQSARHQAASNQATAARSSLAVTDHTGSAPQPSNRRRRRLTEDVNSEERRARRMARRRRQAARLRTTVQTESKPDESAPVERSGGMRFFLNRTSEVEKAPSIGPRTAQMLEAIGIRTVEDFVSMAPDRLAEKLNHRRITRAIIQQWQCQSKLMCQIPELRGHDAQILVACGITTPEGLAAQQPGELYAVVEPFARSREGERIIRNGRKPDLEEVTEWIQWAANARSMRAA